MIFTIVCQLLKFKIISHWHSLNHRNQNGNNISFRNWDKMQHISGVMLLLLLCRFKEKWSRGSLKLQESSSRELSMLLMGTRCHSTKSNKILSTISASVTYIIFRQQLRCSQLGRPYFCLRTWFQGRSKKFLNWIKLDYLLTLTFEQKMQSYFLQTPQRNGSNDGIRPFKSEINIC